MRTCRSKGWITSDFSGPSGCLLRKSVGLVHGQKGGVLLYYYAMIETRPGITHSSEICTEHRNTIQWYNMFYNIIILDIVRLLFVSYHLWCRMKGFTRYPL